MDLWFHHDVLYSTWSKGWGTLSGFKEQEESIELNSINLGSILGAGSKF